MPCWRSTMFLPSTGSISYQDDETRLSRCGTGLSAPIALTSILEEAVPERAFVIQSAHAPPRGASHLQRSRCGSLACGELVLLQEFCADNILDERAGVEAAAASNPPN
jgi:hypothetical protein